jgi:hypothetical protein
LGGYHEAYLCIRDLHVAVYLENVFTIIAGMVFRLKQVATGTLQKVMSITRRIWVYPEDIPQLDVIIMDQPARIWHAKITNVFASE